MYNNKKRNFSKYDKTDKNTRGLDRQFGGDATLQSVDGGAYKGRVSFAHVKPSEDSREASDYINTKSFRQMQQVGTIDVKADPYSQLLRSDVPYAFVEGTNVVTDSSYTGVKNIDGNTIVQMMNSSNNTTLLNTFDSLVITKRLKYLYTAQSKDDYNLAINYEYTKAIAEAMSKGYSTMLTQLPFYTMGIASSIPVLSADGKAETKTAPSNSDYAKFTALIHYQSVLQDLVRPAAKYIQTMSLQGEAMRMSYRRESATLTTLFGLLSKASFKATLNAIGSSILNEYFDAVWYREMNTLLNIPSRKSQGMVDPLMTMVGIHAIPSCQFYSNDTSQSNGFAKDPFYNSDISLAATGRFPDIESFSIPSSASTIPLEDLVFRICYLLDVNTMITWARKANNDKLPSPAPGFNSIDKASAYFEGINSMIEAVQAIATRFTTNMSNIRTMLDRLTQAGFVYWEKGAWINVDNITQVKPTYNKILADVVKCSYSGDATMRWNTATRRWGFRSPFNKYEGFPVYDEMSGGAFLTTSLRSLPTPADGDWLETRYLLPILFTSGADGDAKVICNMTDRYGNSYSIWAVPQAVISTDPMLARLDPLVDGYGVRLPHIILPSSLKAGAERSAIASSALATLIALFGYGRVYTSGVALSNILCTGCDPDILCYLDVELEDVSNATISYARNYSPFRVTTPVGEKTLGFSKR